MNLSGKPVSQIMKKEKIHPHNVLLIHDDLDLDLGAVKIKRGGSAGGHNGVRSVTAYLRTDQYPRIKIGIGRPLNDLPDKIREHVLSGFQVPEQEVLRETSFRKFEKLLVDLLEEFRPPSPPNSNATS
ncbi:hypothetical protein SeLEV6574_g05802 [Synchytrium endobioticum]|nr:hypothetical protein SeLEV6574_g05802 [Synchytrium endobioticum]